MAAGASAGTPWSAARHGFTVQLGVTPCSPCASGPPRNWDPEPFPSHGLADWRCGCHNWSAQGSAIHVSKHSQERYLRARIFLGPASLPGSVRAGLGGVAAGAGSGVAAGAGSAPNGEGGGGRRKGAASYQQHTIPPALLNLTDE